MQATTAAGGFGAGSRALHDRCHTEELPQLQVRKCSVGLSDYDVDNPFFLTWIEYGSWLFFRLLVTTRLIYLHSFHHNCVRSREMWHILTFRVEVYNTPSITIFKMITIKVNGLLIIIRILFDWLPGYGMRSTLEKNRIRIRSSRSNIGSGSRCSD